MEPGGNIADQSRWLLCRVGRVLFGLTANAVAEVMRPLPLEPVSGMPAILSGLSIIRGVPVPVIDAGRLLGDAPARPGRLVTLQLPDRTIALAVEEVTGLRAIPPGTSAQAVHLLQNAAAEAVDSIRALDGELLLLLDAARIVPQSLLDELSAAAAAG